MTLSSVEPTARIVERPLTVVHVGLVGDHPGGMAQVVNGYLTWKNATLHPVGICSTRRKRDRAALPLAFMAAARIARLALTASGPTVAVFHVSEGGSFVREGGLLRLAKLLGLRTVAHVHGADFDDFAAAHPGLVRGVLRSADAVAVLTARSAETVRTLAGARTHVALVRNVVPAAASGGPKERVVLFGGELGPRKGLDVLLDSWRRITVDRPDWQLQLAGPLALGVQLPADLPASVEVLGPLPHDALLERLSAAAVAVLPSRQEALPMFLLEALAARCAVVGSTAGHVPALLADGAGVVVPVGDVDALTAALDDLIAHADRRESLASAGAARFAADYSTDSARPALERFWREVAGD